MKKTAKLTYDELADAEASEEVRDRKHDYEEHGPSSIAPEHDRLNNAVLALPECGCTVIGRGTIPFPIRIKFCDKHRSER